MSDGETTAKTAAALLGERLGDGEGAQKLAHVLYLADYEDDLTLFLADVGAIIAGADALKGEAELTEEDRVLLSKAVRLQSVLLDDDVDRYIAGAMARQAAPVSTSLIAAAVDIVGDETPRLLRPLLWAAALAAGPEILPALRTYTPSPGELRQLSEEPAALAVLRASQAGREALERDLKAGGDVSDDL